MIKRKVIGGRRSNEGAVGRGVSRKEGRKSEREEGGREEYEVRWLAGCFPE